MSQKQKGSTEMTDQKRFTALASDAVLDAEVGVMWFFRTWNRARVAWIIASLRRIEEAYPR